MLEIRTQIKEDKKTIYGVSSVADAQLTVNELG